MSSAITYLRSRPLQPSLLASTLATLLCASGTLMAQSTSGDISGTASYVPGEIIKATNTDNGVIREIKLNADGRFHFSSLPIGHYLVTLQNGADTVKSVRLSVVAGQTIPVALLTTGSAGHETAKSLSTVTVTSNTVPSIDVSSVETRTTFTAERLNSLPIPRDVTDVALLTPGTVRGSGNFGNLASFGGSSVAENSYYVNGFNTTNLFNSLSFSEIPYQAIEQIDVQTGGYGAQYGYSTGGVTSVNLKHGTNQWKGGLSYVTAPNAWRSHYGDVVAKNGNILYSNSHDTDTDNVYTAWLGGPLIEDKLFIFMLGQFERETSTTLGQNSNYALSSIGPSTSRSNRATRDSPYWVIKLDWNINDHNHFEYTGFNNTRKSQYNYYGTQYSGGSDASLASFSGTENDKTGGQTNIFKYTSYITDDLTLSAQYGQLKSTNSSSYVSPDGIVSRYDGDIDTNAGVCPSVAYNNAYTGPRYTGCAVTRTLGLYGGEDSRKSWRVDLDWRVGDHDIGLGYDDERWKSQSGQSYSGGNYYLYYPNNRVYDIVFKTGGNIGIRQKAAYLEDHWQVSDRVMLYGGIRYDGFANYNSSGQIYVKQANIWQPRIGVSWDVLGDQSWKVFANAGRYSLPIAANVALRAASASYYTQNLYSYTSINPTTGAPEGTKLISPYVINGENGSTPNAKSVADKNLKPYTQDEFILGFQHQIHSDNAFLDRWTVGTRAIYRKLRASIDDTCDWRPFYNQAVALGLDTSGQDQWNVPEGVPGCFIYNPGSALSLDVDLDSSGKPRQITVPGNQLGNKASRQYEGIELTAEKSTERFYINASYTWSRSFGNTEGLVRSDIGQADTGTTEDFDFPEIMYGAGGYLSNDRRHSLKVYGGWKISPEWSAGVNVLVQSGTPISCLGGGYGTFGTEYGYSGGFHYCNGEISSVGTSGRTPWIYTISPNVIYKPQWARGLNFTLSVMNLLNNRQKTQVYQVGENLASNGTNTSFYSTTYKVGEYFNQPRYVRLQVQYDFTL